VSSSSFDSCRCHDAEPLTSVFQGNPLFEH
jgi:hypothetical protein